jgi:hypothetical protein
MGIANNVIILVNHVKLHLKTVLHVLRAYKEQIKLQHVVALKGTMILVIKKLIVKSVILNV